MHAATKLIVIHAFALTMAATAAAAETSTPPPAPEPDGAASRVLTGKERLGRKWADEQRVDNCNVPPDKRGDKPRTDCDKPQR
jgi:hypothetical protein